MNARLYSINPPHYTVRPCAEGWAVVHALPGQPGRFAIDVACPTEQAAEVECAYLLRQRDQEQARQRAERALLGLHANRGAA